MSCMQKRMEGPSAIGRPSRPILRFRRSLARGKKSVSPSLSGRPCTIETETGPCDGKEGSMLSDDGMVSAPSTRPLWRAWSSKRKQVRLNCRRLLLLHR